MSNPHISSVPVIYDNMAFIKLLSESDPLFTEMTSTGVGSEMSSVLSTRTSGNTTHVGFSWSLSSNNWSGLVLAPKLGRNVWRKVIGDIEGFGGESPTFDLGDELADDEVESSLPVHPPVSVSIVMQNFTALQKELLSFPRTRGKKLWSNSSREIILLSKNTMAVLPVASWNLSLNA